MIPLYPFRAEALAAIEAAARTGARRLLLPWATGLGKTVAFSHVIAHRPGRALVLAPLHTAHVEEARRSGGAPEREH